MDCQKKMNDQPIAYPVFFDVEPTEVRKQSGAVGAAFTKHGNNESAGKWREAFQFEKLTSWSLLFELQGTQATKCITLNAYGFNWEILMNGLANMKELRFLHVDSPYVSEEEVSKWNFDEDSLHLPNALRFLNWSGYPFSSLPKIFQAKDLVGLQMQLSNMVQLWKDGEEKACLNLRFLNFTWSLLRTLDLSVSPNLETLFLEDCWDLVEIHFQVTPNLKELRIYDCDRLEKLHMPAQSPNLETLNVNNCTGLVELQIPAECPKLVNLNLSNCIHVAELPEEIGRLEGLRELNIAGTGIRRLPESIFRVKGLRIVGSRQLLESCGFTSEIKTSHNKRFCYIYIRE